MVYSASLEIRLSNGMYWPRSDTNNSRRADIEHDMTLIERRGMSVAASQ